MKPEQIRIAIAEVCGWRPDPKGGWIKPNGDWTHCLDSVPDYLNDLNAIHEAEKVLDEMEKTQKMGDGFYGIRYGNELVRITNRLTPYHATAAQRCEALLRALNLWRE